MDRRTTANGIGCLSVACSLAFWLWAGLFLFTPLNKSEAWLRLVDEPVLWIMLWIAGFLLGLIATALGSKRWAFAAVLALVSFGAAVAALSGVDW